MKKLFCLILMLTVLVSCASQSRSTSSPLDYSESVASTNLQSETGGLDALGISEQDIIKSRGEPHVRGTLKTGEVILSYEDYHYTLLKDRLVNYTLVPGQRTANHVSTGDDRGRITEAYGQNFYTRTDNKLSIMGYVDKENNRAIEFVLNQNEVELIVVYDLSPYSK